MVGSQESGSRLAHKGSRKGQRAGVRSLGNSRTRVVRLAELEIKSVRNVNLTTLDTVLYGTGGCVAEMTSVNVK